MLIPEQQTQTQKSVQGNINNGQALWLLTGSALLWHYDITVRILMLFTVMSTKHTHPLNLYVLAWGTAPRSFKMACGI